MSFIPYRSRAGEEGFFKPDEMSTLAIFAEITAFEHAYHLNNGDPVFRDYFVYAGSASGKLLLDQPGMFGDFEGTLGYWQDELRAFGSELDIYGFSYLHQDQGKRANGKVERGLVVYVESRSMRSQVYYLPLHDAEEVAAAGKKLHPMFREWMPAGIILQDQQAGWFLLNDEQGRPISSPKRQEPEVVAFGPVEFALRNLGNVLHKAASPYHAALILTYEGSDDRHAMVEADDTDGLHDQVWAVLHEQAESQESFRGYCFAVDAFLTGEAKERNAVFLVQSEYYGTKATVKGYGIKPISLFGDIIGLMQNPREPALFERPPVRTLFVQE